MPVAVTSKTWNEKNGHAIFLVVFSVVTWTFIAIVALA